MIVVFPDHTHLLYSHATHIKRVFFHFVVYLFKDMSCYKRFQLFMQFSAVVNRYV